MSPPSDDVGHFGVSAIRVDRVGVDLDAFIGGSSRDDRSPTGRIERTGVVVVVVVVVVIVASSSRVPSSTRARASVASAFRDASSLDAVVSISLSLFAPTASSLATVVSSTVFPSARSFGVSSSLALTSYASKKWTSIGVASNPLETRAFAPFGVFTGGRNDEDDAIDRARDDDEASAPSVSVARTSDE
jgi:hypothetical protein